MPPPTTITAPTLGSGFWVLGQTVIHGVVFFMADKSLFGFWVFGSIFHVCVFFNQVSLGSGFFYRESPPVGVVREPPLQGIS
jgi:hypothetical protein